MISIHRYHTRRSFAAALVIGLCIGQLSLAATLELPLDPKDATHFEGLAGLAAGYAGARFDNFSLIAE